jgi:hypothetical protein
MAHHVLRLTLCRLSLPFRLMLVLENGCWLAGRVHSPTQSFLQSFSEAAARGKMSSKSLRI